MVGLSGVTRFPILKLHNVPQYAILYVLIENRIIYVIFKKENYSLRKRN